MSKTELNILTAFDQLPAQDVREGAIVAHDLQVSQGLYVGKDSSNFLLVLFADSEPKILPTRKFKNLRIEFSARYEIEIAGTAVAKDFTLMKLTSTDRGMQEAFCTLVETFVNSLPPEPTTSEVRSIVERIMELFLATPKVSKNAVVGLWGELVFIRLAKDPNINAEAWHVSPSAKSDFSFSTKFVEVKTTDSSVRLHSLRIHQLLQPEKPVFIASVQLTPDTSGKNLLELLTDLLTVLTPKNQQHVVDVFFRTIGTDLEETENLRFTLMKSAEEIFILNAMDLPRPIIPEVPSAAAIGKVSFELDFDTLISLGVPNSNLSLFEV